MPRQLFKPGQSGNPSGRPKSERVNVREVLANVEYEKNGVKYKGVDVFKELAILGATAKSEKVRREACADLAPFLAPKLKSIEHIGDSQAPLSINLVLSNDS